MTVELNPLFKNHIWELVDFHLGKSMVWCMLKCFTEGVNASMMFYSDRELEAAAA